MDLLNDRGPSSDATSTKDTHYQPAQPDDYCVFRIEKALRMYKARIPKCYKDRYIAQTCLVLGSVLCVLFAAFGIIIYAAIVSIVTSGITAWLEFNGTNSKITRYSSTVDGLQNLLGWWRTRQTIEKSSTANIDLLVISTEELLRSEVNAWRSTSQASKLLAKESGQSQDSASAKSGNGNGGSSGNNNKPSDSAV